MTKPAVPFPGMLELRIQGPLLDEIRPLGPGEPELVLGRDTACAVCLPDPQRNISRRHLALRNEAGALHFHVLSEVNGVVVPFGEAPPGARGVLAAGEVLQLADYRISARPLVLEADADPWAVLERESSGVAPPPVQRAAQDDPFGDWGFETTFGPGSPAGPPLQASQLAPAADLGAFFRGLGLEAERTALLTEGELEGIGKLVRSMALGLLELRAISHAAAPAQSAGERNAPAPPARNPLRADGPADTKLRYLFAARAAGGSFMPPQQAMRELLSDLLAREHALGPARSPPPGWTQRMLGKYFTAAYPRERERQKQQGSGAAAGPPAEGRD